MGEKIKLKTAIENCPLIYNSYTRCRQEAKDYGYISIGDVKVAVNKEKGAWQIDKDEFNAAVKRLRVTIEEEEKRQKQIQEEEEKCQKQIEEDYQKGIYHPGIVSLNNKCYRNYGDFRFELNDYDVARGKSDGNWYCNLCNIPAETEHNKPECHTCSDWNGCGTDCTLSKVYCSRCGKYLLR